MGEKEQKLGLFFRALLGLKGEVISSFINFFWEVLIIVWFFFNLFQFIILWGDGFSPQILIYTYIYMCVCKSFQVEETNKDLIIYIPVLLKWKKFSS